MILTPQPPTVTPASSAREVLLMHAEHTCIVRYRKVDYRLAVLAILDWRTQGIISDAAADEWAEIILQRADADGVLRPAKSWLEKLADAVRFIIGGDSEDERRKT